MSAAYFDALPDELLTEVLDLALSPTHHYQWERFTRQRQRFQLQLVCKRVRTLLAGIDAGQLAVKPSMVQLVTERAKSDAAFASITKLFLELIDWTKLARGQEISAAREGMQADAAAFSALLPLLPNVESLHLTTCRPHAALLNLGDYEMASWGEEGPDETTLPLDAHLNALSRLTCLGGIRHLILEPYSWEGEEGLLSDGVCWHAVCALLEALPGLETVKYNFPGLLQNRFLEPPTTAHPHLKRITTCLDMFASRLLSTPAADEGVEVKLTSFARLGKGKDTALLSRAKSIDAPALVLDGRLRGDEEEWEMWTGGPARLKVSCVEIVDADYAKTYLERLTSLNELSLGYVGEPNDDITTEGDFKSVPSVSVNNLISLVQQGVFSSLKTLKLYIIGWSFEQEKSLRAACELKGIELIDDAAGWK